MSETDLTTTATTSSLSTPGSVHLLVLIHGMWGNPIHLAELERIAKETHSKPNQDGERLETLLPKTNTEDSTYDGIDWGGERVAQEVRLFSLLVRPVLMALNRSLIKLLSLRSPAIP
jgi:Putative serine esterase (DUF676)